MAKQVTVTKRDGRVTVDTDLNYLFSTMRNGTYHLIIKRASEARTIAQNDLMWMWMQCIEHETGTPKQDVYSYYCKKFLMKTIRIGERLEKVYDTTSKLNTKQMSDFITIYNSKTHNNLIYLEPDDIRQLRENALVRIIDGPYKDCVGYYQRVKGTRDKRFVVRLDFFMACATSLTECSIIKVEEE